MRKVSLFIAVFICLLSVAQPPTGFYTRFGGLGVDVGYGVKQTLDKQYIVVGSTTSYGAGYSDVYLVKVDSMGNPIWAKTFGGFGNDVGRAVIQLPDSSYVIAGFTNSFGGGGYDAIVIRTDKNGNQLWQKTFGGADWDFAYDLVWTTDSHIAVCGVTESFGNGKKDGFIIKLDIGGVIAWQKYYGGVEDDELNAIILTNDNQLATVGYNKSKGDLNGDFYFLKIDLNGDTLFTRGFGGQWTDFGTDLVQKSTGEYILVGAKTFSANGYSHSVNVNFSVSGSFNWEGDFFASSSNEQMVAVSNSYAGPLHTCYIRNVPVSGLKMQANIFVANNGIYPYVVNSSGGSEDEITYGIDATKDGGYVTVGTTNSFGAKNGDVYFIKQDSTLINYQSIVSVKENAEPAHKAVLKNAGENLYEVNMFGHHYATISIVDIQGKTLYEANVAGDKEYISLNNFQKGMYLMVLKSSTERPVTFKLICN